MIPFLSIIIVLFVVVFTYRVKKTSADQEEVLEKFSERERLANATRRKDISNLDYITIPEEFLLPDMTSESSHRILALRGKKMLNLSDMTNTDLKLQYGMQNLEELSEYDDNFSELLRYLPEYTEELVEKGHRDIAVAILQFAVDNGSDSKRVKASLDMLMG